MHDFTVTVDIYDDGVEAILNEIQGNTIVDLHLYEDSDAIALEFDDGRLLEFSEEGCLVLIDQEGGQRPVLQLGKEHQWLAELAFWGFAGC